MDVTLQRHCAKYIYAVPEGLRELMSDISREVLRSQPQHIYTFIADYLDALLITRENARVAAKLVESLTEIGVTITELLTRTGMTREEADKVAAIIQIAFRKHLADRTAIQEQLANEAVDEANIIEEVLDEAEIDPEQTEQAAIIIQNAYREFKRKQEREKDLFKGMIDWRVAARSTMRLYRKTGVTYEEANRAATLIKAAYKGYYTRRIMKRLLEEANVAFEEEEEEQEEEVQEEFEFEAESTEKFALPSRKNQEEKDVDVETAETDVLPDITDTISSEEAVSDVITTIIKKVIPSATSLTETTVETAFPSELTEVQTEVTESGGSPEDVVQPENVEAPTENIESPQTPLPTEETEDEGEGDEKTSGEEAKAIGGADGEEGRGDGAAGDTVTETPAVPEESTEAEKAADAEITAKTEEVPEATTETDIKENADE